jgi:acyl carrier protein
MRSEHNFVADDKSLKPVVAAFTDIVKGIIPVADAITLETIHQQLCTEIETLLSLKSGSVKTDTDLTVLGIDSLRFVSLLLAIEQRFGVNLMKTGLTNEDTKTVRCLAAAVQAGRNV